MIRPLTAAVLLLALGLAAPWLRPAGLRAPPTVPRTQAEPWMAEALPGVGPKTAPRMLEAIRHGHHDQLPARARASAEAWFER